MMNDGGKGKRQKAEGKRQKAKGRRQKAKGERQKNRRVGTAHMPEAKQGGETINAEEGRSSAKCQRIFTFLFEIERSIKISLNQDVKIEQI